MYFYLKRKGDNIWQDVTKYIQLPITIFDTKDGKDSQAKITMYFTSDFKLIDIRKPIQPNLDFKISDVNSESLETNQNTFWFKTDGGNALRLRKQVIDENGNTILEELWEHVFIVKDYITKLNNSLMPNYTITQPKSEFYNVYRRSRGAIFDIGQIFEQDGNPKILYKGNKNYNNEFRFLKDNISMINIDYKNGKHYAEMNDINELSYSINFSMFLNTSAPSTFTTKFIWETRRKMHAYDMETGLLNNSSSFDLKATTYYYQNEEKIDVKTNFYNIKSSGSKIKVENWSSGGSTTKITGFDSSPQENQIYLNVAKNQQATKAIVEFEISNTRHEANVQPVDHNYHAFIKFENNNISTGNVVCLVSSVNITVTSSASTEELQEDYITYYEFLEKALFDYNFNNRNKISLSEDLRTILSEPAKESEWVDFTFKELVDRLFKYLGIIPILSYDNVLSYLVEKKVSVDFNIELDQSIQKEQTGSDFYDKIVSNTKNLVSEQDIIKDVVLISSSETEFSQMGNENLGFILGSNIYYVARGIVHIPNLNFDFTQWDAEIINTNIDKPYYWDITTRLFEEDIYNSFPNVRYDTSEGGRSQQDLYSKGNTLYYKSGENFVKGLGNQADSIPDFNLWTTTPILNVAEYALIETLIVLAIGQIPSTEKALEVAKQYSETFTLQDFDYQDTTLRLEYAAIYKELTTKYVSNAVERKGINKEHKVNMNDRTVSYQESEEVLRNEMNRKGNVKEVFEENYRNLEEIIPNLSIVADNLYVTSKLITIENKAITVEYTLQKNFILQNDDIRLGVEFERYNVPYEYVNREVLIENHLIFNNKKALRYSVDPKGSDINLVKRILIPTENKHLKLNNPIYTKSQISLSHNSDLEVLTRVGMLENKTALIFNGSFLDNYTAGIQRYTVQNNLNERLLFSQPMAYTDTKGNFDNISNFKIGWNDYVTDDSRLGDLTDLKLFPNAKRNVGGSLDLNHTLYNNNFNVVLNKDARERISFNYTSFLENDNENIKWYGFKPITQIGALFENFDFVENISLNDIEYQLFNDKILQILVTESIDNLFEVTITLKDLYESDFPYGIVFISEKGSKQYLTGLLKNAIFEDNKVIFYITTTRYGFWDERGAISRIKPEILVTSNINMEFEINKPFIANLFVESNVNTEFLELKHFNDILSFNIFVNSDISYVFAEREEKSKRLDPYIFASSNISRIFLEGNKATIKLDPYIFVSSSIDFLMKNHYNVSERLDFNIFVSSDINYNLVDQKLVLGEYDFKINATSDINKQFMDNPEQTVLLWTYKGASSQPFCFSAGYNPIGTVCSIENEVMVVSGTDISKSGDCHELICKKI